MRRFVLRFVVLLCAALLPVFSCGAAFAEQELIVSAAASLTNAFQEVGKKFESANPGVKFVPNFAASGALLQQIDKGAPVDVFASADQKTMDQAAEKNLLLAGSRKDFVCNELSLVLPMESKISVKTLKDLTAKEVGKISLGNPETVPAGRYTQEALAAEGLWDALQPKLIFGDSVRQVLDYVSRGEVDAAFVFSTDAAIARDKVRVAMEVSNHKPIRYPIAVVAQTKNKQLAQRFVDYILSKEGQEILSKYGFKAP